MGQSCSYLLFDSDLKDNFLFVSLLVLVELGFEIRAYALIVLIKPALEKQALYLSHTPVHFALVFLFFLSFFVFFFFFGTGV
jgi:TRAP-type C4-dicarboxylate transport system permease large subunit